MGAPAGTPGAAKARPTWDEYFLQLALQAATRSTCLRRRVGAVGSVVRPLALRRALELAVGHPEEAARANPHHLDRAEA